MENKYVIRVKNIDLIYKTSESISVKKLIKNIISRKKINFQNSYKALNNVSFDIERGKVYGIIGKNGAGKSTLLRVLSGVMEPNKGTVERNYKTINLLALGAGFSRELSGYDNIFLNGFILGFTKKQIQAVIQDIIDYSELGNFISMPMKTYSSGMVSRLGFSVAINLKPEVLLIDEVLSVGDAHFKKKSYDSIKKIIDNKDTTVIIVSHSMGETQKICNNLIWLEKGEIVAKGATNEIISLYNDFVNSKINLNDIKSSARGDKIE